LAVSEQDRSKSSPSPQQKFLSERNHVAVAFFARSLSVGLIFIFSAAVSGQAFANRPVRI
jgi:hypothetical protein